MSSSTTTLDLLRRFLDTPGLFEALLFETRKRLVDAIMTAPLRTTPPTGAGGDS